MILVRVNGESDSRTHSFQNIGYSHILKNICNKKDICRVCLNRTKLNNSLEKLIFAATVSHVDG